MLLGKNMFRFRFRSADRLAARPFQAGVLAALYGPPETLSVSFEVREPILGGALDREIVRQQLLAAGLLESQKC